MSSSSQLEAMRAPKASYEALSTAVAYAGEAVVITDAGGLIVYVNPRFEALSGYSRAELLGRNPRMLQSGLQDVKLYADLWETITAGEVWRGRLVNRKKDGTVYTLDGTIAPVRDATGAIVGYVAVRADVTAALALEAQFLQAQKMEAVGRLASGIAHDFNNLLCVILSYADLIGEDLAAGEPMRGDVEEIKRAACRATELSSQLLAFSRRQALEARVLSLNDTLVETEKMVARMLGADIALSILPASGLWNVKADPGQVEQVLMNLAVNARDAMPRGGRLTIETANVRLDAPEGNGRIELRPGAYVRVTVSDTGTGMDAGTLERAFEPFFTTKEKGKGTGLGLATVLGIVRQMGGQVSVDTQPGKGTSFRIDLPRFDGAVAPRSASSSAELAPERGTETVLLVEDDEQVRRIARSLLHRSGYVVLEAANAGEALLVSEEQGATIDLLLSDVVLPRMSGPHLSSRLRALQPRMKVLFMSGYAPDAVLPGAVESGVAFLQKPFTPSSLARKVREVLDGGRRRSV